MEPPSLAAKKGGPAETGGARATPGWGSPKIRIEAVDYGTVELLVLVF
jgi:hypothetical protein